MGFSKSETGHAINVAKMGGILEIVDSLGIAYNPPKDYLQIDALRTSLGLGEAALTVVSDLSGRFNEHTNERKLLFLDMPLLATNVIDLLVVAEASQATLEDAYGVNRKIRGRRSSPKGKKADADGGSTDATAPDAKTISVSQQSFVNKAAHWARMVSIARATPGYASNEYNFSLPGLDAHTATLKAKNDQMQKLGTDLLTARTTRDELLYKKTLGMYDMSKAIKRYVRSLLGFKDPRYIALSKIILTKPASR